MEHRRNDSKHHCKPKFNDDLFRYWNKFWRLLRNRLRDCVSGQRSECNGNRQSVNSMFRIIKHNHRQWRY